MIKLKFKSIIDKLDIRWRQRVPLVHQTESSECGLACLAMVCGFYGKNIDLISLRQQFNLSSRGTSLAALNEISSQLGMMTRGLSVELHEIDVLKKPCIIHWDFNHFVVLVSSNRQKFVIHDPARGRRVVDISEMSKHFTGVAFEVWPDSSFVTETVRNRISLGALIGSVKGIKGSLTKIFALSVVIEAINLVIPIGTQLVMDHTISASDKGLLSLICISLLFFIILRAATGAIRAWSSLVMSTLIDVQWKAGLFRHLIRLPLEFFERRKLGDIQSRFSSLSALRNTFTTSVVGAIMDMVMVAGVLAMMIFYGGTLTWVVLGFTAVYVLIRLLTFNRYRQLSEEYLVREARAGSYFMETLYGISTIKIQGMSDRRINNWMNLEIDSVNSHVKISKMNFFFSGINTVISACDQVIILWLGISLVIDSKMTIGMFFAFSAFRSQFSERMTSLINFILELRMMSLHNERVSDIALNKIQKQKPEISYDANGKSISLEARNISYRYDKQSSPIFKDFSLTILSGESVAIVGQSGSGKTTLIKVLCGLFNPELGSIYIDGVDIKQLGINNYHKMISCVMQDDKLFSGTIRENICGFEENVDDDWMVECAKASYIHDVIENMPMGYDTLIGELGEGLSGGQKQRIFIARAIYRRPGILFMDEATSSLDKESELVVNQAIKDMNITRVVIAHRESTISFSDRVIMMS